MTEVEQKSQTFAKYFGLQMRLEGFKSKKGKQATINRIKEYFAKPENNPIHLANDIRFVMEQAEPYLLRHVPDDVMLNMRMPYIIVDLLELADALDGQDHFSKNLLKPEVKKLTK